MKAYYSNHLEERALMHRIAQHYLGLFYLQKMLFLMDWDGIFACTFVRNTNGA